MLGDYLQQTQTAADDIFRCIFVGALKSKMHIGQFFKELLHFLHNLEGGPRI